MCVCGIYDSTRRWDGMLYVVGVARYLFGIIRGEARRNFAFQERASRPNGTFQWRRCCACVCVCCEFACVSLCVRVCDRRVFDCVCGYSFCLFLLSFLGAILTARLLVSHRETENTVLKVPQPGSRRRSVFFLCPPLPLGACLLYIASLIPKL